MTSYLRPEPPIEDARHVAHNLRARDRAELFATKYGDDPEQIAQDAVRSGAFRWGAYAADGEPVAMFGAMPRWPGVWTAWAYGTDRWPETINLVTRHVRRFMLPALLNADAHRVDAFALEDHKDARAWLSFLGAQQTNKLDKWGKNGENFICYTWTRETSEKMWREVNRRAPA